ncbi:MAG: hypothetical protein V3V67_16090 [Myxococcota bacterium]
MMEYAEGLVEQPALDSREQGDLLDVLEERLKLLVGRHRVALSECDDQRRLVSERERMITELSARVASLEKLRAEALARVERLIDDVDRLERGLEAEARA